MQFSFIIVLNHNIQKFPFQAERLRKEEADAHRKAEDEAKKKSALTNMGSGYSSLQRVGLSHGGDINMSYVCEDKF